MKHNLNRLIAIFLCMLLALGALGCSRAADDGKAAIQNAEGRYVEREISLPLPEGSTEQYVIGVGSSENGIEAFTNTYVGTEEQTTVQYQRQTIHSDGTVTAAAETWLNSLASAGGNEMRVQQAQDGALYMIYWSAMMMVKRARV